jgi:hypothetical protein
MGYSKSNFKLESPSPSPLKQYTSISCKGDDKVINFCSSCGSLLFGGKYGEDGQHTVYAGSLDAEFRDEFKPRIAIFTSKRPKWAKIEIGLKEFEMMPGI